MKSVCVDVAIFGGGTAGLWLLGEARRRGYNAILFESDRLGQGQTVCAQGILHSGLKYMLNGLLNASAREAREMPARWKRCLTGIDNPDLRTVSVLSDSFYLWGTDSTFSRLGLFGAKLGLQVTPKKVPKSEVPSVLHGCGGPILNVEEQTISPVSLIECLSRSYGDSTFLIGKSDNLDVVRSADGSVQEFSVESTDGFRQVRVQANQIVLTAGSGNGPLRQAFGLSRPEMQLRPLHMVLLRGNLPVFYGHCVSGAKTRISITSVKDQEDRTVWQIGGQIAEDGVSRSVQDQIAVAQAELNELMPQLLLHDAKWSTYRVNRAEGVTLSGARPESFRLVQDQNVITAWPTKLVLVPQLVDAVLKRLTAGHTSAETDLSLFDGFARPEVALPPWDLVANWIRSDRLQSVSV